MKKISLIFFTVLLYFTMTKQGCCNSFAGLLCFNPPKLHCDKRMDPLWCTVNNTVLDRYPTSYSVVVLTMTASCLQTAIGAYSHYSAKQCH